MSYDITTKVIKESFTYEDKLMVDLQIDYPQISGDLHIYCIMSFDRYYKRNAIELRQYAKTKLFEDAVNQYKYAQEQGYPFNNYVVVQTYDVTYNTKEYVSLYYDVYEYTGGAHGMTEKTGNTWAIRKGHMVRMKDLFVPGYDYKSVMLDYIYKEAVHNQNEGDVLYFDDLEQNITEYFDEKNFYLTDEGIAIFYPLYSIAPYAAGIQVFVVPYELFNDAIVI